MFRLNTMWVMLLLQAPFAREFMPDSVTVDLYTFWNSLMVVLLLMWERMRSEAKKVGHW